MAHPLLLSDGFYLGKEAPVAPKHLQHLAHSKIKPASHTSQSFWDSTWQMLVQMMNLISMQKIKLTTSAFSTSIMTNCLFFSSLLRTMLSNQPMTLLTLCGTPTVAPRALRQLFPL